MSWAPGSSSAEPVVVGAGTLADLVTMADAVDAVEAVFAGIAGFHSPLRSAMTTAHGQVLTMPAAGDALAGVKVVTVAPGNPTRDLPRIQGCYLLFDAATLAPLALIDAVALTSLRTPATSAVGIRHCTAEDASHLVVFGTGPQAWGHIEAMAAVRPLRRVGVVARSAQRRASFLERVAASGWEGYPATPGDVADADVVCLCTTARTPVIDGGLLPAHGHVVAVGSHEPDAREVDTETVRRAAVVVEDRDAAWAEAGDLVLAVADGVPADDVIACDLHELVTGAGPPPDRLTLYKSVGIAVEDLAVAGLAWSRLQGASGATG